MTCKGWGVVVNLGMENLYLAKSIHPRLKTLENSDNVVGISGSRTGTGRSSFIVWKSSLYLSLSYVRSKQCTYSARP